MAKEVGFQTLTSGPFKGLEVFNKNFSNVKQAETFAKKHGGKVLRKEFNPYRSFYVVPGTKQKSPVTNKRIREVERAYLANDRARNRYHKMIQTGAYNKMTPGQQEKFARLFAKADDKVRESFNDVLRLRKRAAQSRTPGRSTPFAKRGM
jgi:hypothetical protein